MSQPLSRHSSFPGFPLPKPLLRTIEAALKMLRQHYGLGWSFKEDWHAIGCRGADAKSDLSSMRRVEEDRMEGVRGLWIHACQRLRRVDAKHIPIRRSIRDDDRRAYASELEKTSTRIRSGGVIEFDLVEIGLKSKAVS